MPTTPAPSTTTSNSWLAISDLQGCTRAGMHLGADPLCHWPESFVGACGFNLHRRREQVAPLFRVWTSVRFFCLRVSGVVAPSAPAIPFPGGESLLRGGICGPGEPPSIAEKGGFWSPVY